MQDIENKPSITPSEEKLGGVHDSTVPTLPEAGIDGATSSAAARQQTFKYDEKDPAEGKLNTKFDWFIMVPVCIIVRSWIWSSMGLATVCPSLAFADSSFVSVALVRFLVSCQRTTQTVAAFEEYSF